MVYSLNEVLLNLDSNLDDGNLSCSDVHSKSYLKVSPSETLSRKNSADPFGRSVGTTNYETEVEEMQINSPSNNFGWDLTNHEEFVNMREGKMLIFII